jgi:hypothetical protein
MFEQLQLQLSSSQHQQNGVNEKALYTLQLQWVWLGKFHPGI